MIPPHINILADDPQDAEDEYGEGYCEYCDNDGNECVCDEDGNEDEWEELDDDFFGKYPRGTGDDE